MKTFFQFFLLTGSLFMSVSCSRNSNDMVTNPGQTVVSGAWRVSLFSNSGNNETIDFTGYVFTFNTGGVVAVAKSSTIQNGTWSINNSSTKFSVDLGAKLTGNLPLGELTHEWKILSSNATEIRLGDDNPSSNEFLTFTKN
ncbi:MAG: hypothetical protein ABI675_18075 [Chitinophagaceae bacterium]